MPPDSSQPIWVDDPDAAPTARTRLPVVVIGAGPVGLAAAAHLLDRGLEPLVLEAGPQVGANIAQWRHVQFFSPWCLALDPVSVRLLHQAGWTGPDADLLEHYLQPLAALPALASRIRLNTTVVAVARHDLDKVRSPGRDQLPFLVRVRDPHGQLRDLQARAVIDASGTWTQPNPLGASGLPALGEPDAGSRIAYGLPDILGADRGRLATDLAALVDAGRIELATGFRIHTVEPAGDRVRLVGDQLHDQDLADATGLRIEADQVIAATGFRPDHAIAAELRLGLEPALESPTALAPLIDPNVHTCGTVPAHGIAELAHPEPGYVLVGMKSYGRAPTFLRAPGRSHVRQQSNPARSRPPPPARRNPCRADWRGGAGHRGRLERRHLLPLA